MDDLPPALNVGYLGFLALVGVHVQHPSDLLTCDQNRSEIVFGWCIKLNDGPYHPSLFDPFNFRVGDEFLLAADFDYADGPGSDITLDGAEAHPKLFSGFAECVAWLC